MTELSLTPKRREILAKRGITTVEQLARLFPRKYKDYTNTYTQPLPELNGKEGCFIGVLKKLSSSRAATGCSCVKFKLIMDADKKVSVNIFGKAYMKKMLEYLEEKRVVVCGTINYHEVYGFTIMDPDNIVTEEHLKDVQRVLPVYTKISGISEDTLHTLIKDAVDSSTYPEWNHAIVDKYGFSNLPTLKDAVNILHNPDNISQLSGAQKRVDMDDLLEFCLSLEKRHQSEPDTTNIILKHYTKQKEMLAMLPYALTDDQRKYCKEMLVHNRAGKRISALLQGDVGCGKTVVAFLMLVVMAENGYQGVLMAPTEILAKQHFRELKEYTDNLGIKTEYLDGKIKSSAKKKILQDISTGDIDILVGTQAVSSSNPDFHNLGMVIIDEEHRFGVEQREVLMRHAANGVNTLLMSATPMPRSLAASLYGNNTAIYDIRTKPACRIPVQTAINNNKEVIFDFIEKQLREGRQAYVVCPLIESNEESELMKDVVSVTDRYSEYKKRFEPEFKVGMLNGKMKEEELNKIITDFKNNDIQILISTTVIEVGVNVPNASVMVISNAERFGLATMHQLRGRVGRGSHKAYCILQSEDRTNERLHVLASCADGFEISNRDLSLRGAGELTGLKQSGFTKQMELILKYPEEFGLMKDVAKEMVNVWEMLNREFQTGA